MLKINLQTALIPLYLLGKLFCLNAFTYGGGEAGNDHGDDGNNNQNNTNNGDDGDDDVTIWSRTNPERVVPLAEDNADGNWWDNFFGTGCGKWRK